tara:strand:- start:246 stop:452 length:207 start_codon:yes stop_codon:yes gene_type:complete
MYFPFFKKNSFEVIESLSNLDAVSRNPFLKSNVNPSIKGSSSISKVVIHLAWLKEQSRGFCEADEIAF